MPTGESSHRDLLTKYLLGGGYPPRKCLLASHENSSLIERRGSNELT